MPLRAQINGNDVIAPLMDDPEWNELKRAVKHKDVAVILPCCQSPAFLRVSPLGTKHFVHRRKQHCQWKSESTEKIQLKSEIALACKASGYEVSTEVAENEWRADVLASKGRVKIAFEVLLSSKSLEDILRAQQQYARNGIRGCWLVKHVPKAYRTPSHELPLFQLTSTPEKSHSVSIESSEWIPDEEKQQFPLYDFVTELLSGKIHFCRHLRARPPWRVTIVFFDMACWRCHRISHVFAVEEDGYTSICGREMYVEDGLWSEEHFCFRPEILHAVREYLQTPEAKHLTIGAIKRRYSHTVKESYKSFGCAYCDAILGDWYVHEAYVETMEEEGRTAIELLVTIPEPLLSEAPHWCYSEERLFCDPE